MPQRPSPYRTQEGTYRCPTCSEEGKPVEYKNLSGLKYHMTSVHGGFTGEELAESVEDQRERTEAPAEPKEPTSQRQPRRTSKRNNELNEKANRVLRLGIRSLLSGLTPEEKQEFDALSDEISSASIGVEFDFDNPKLVRASGRAGLVLLAIFLALVPHAPTNLKERFALLFNRKKPKLVKMPGPKEPEPGPEEGSENAE